METFKTLWKYCTDNKRIVPKEWNKLYKRLKNKKISPSLWEPEPPVDFTTEPLSYFPPREVHLIFKKHIKWAEEQQQLDEIGDYLKSLPEDKWYHYGEL